MAPATDGKTYPVFRLADNNKLTERVRQELKDSFAQQVLQLDRMARNLIASERGGAGEAWLHAPMYLLLSNEEGGFARFGFWLEDAAGKRQLIPAEYVDLVVNERSVESGDFEEIFSHELGHLILKALVGPPAEGLSRKMHQSMTITDYPTALDEGFAEHFQPLALDASHNAYLRQLAGGTKASDLERLWVSGADGEARIDGVKHNLFIHRKPIPERALDGAPDLYRLFLESETSTVFLPTELRNGQQMLASEGVISTIFYRAMNDEKLRSRYREPEFYRPFLGSAPADPAAAVSPYQNAALKFFAAMRKMERSDRPAMVRLFESYARLFPDEGSRSNLIFVETTWGATASGDLARQMQTAAETGGMGDMERFRPGSRNAFSLLNATAKEVTDGKLALDANIGPELWILNRDFLIGEAVWSKKRTEPLTINLNTATAVELMTIPGIDLAAARRILAARDRTGYFHQVDELQPLCPPEIFARIQTMVAAMKQAGGYQRQ